MERESKMEHKANSGKASSPKVTYINANALPHWRVEVEIECDDDEYKYAETFVVPAPNKNIAIAIARGVMMANPEIGISYMLSGSGSNAKTSLIYTPPRHLLTRTRQNRKWRGTRESN